MDIICNHGMELKQKLFPGMWVFEFILRSGHLSKYASPQIVLHYHMTQSFEFHNITLMWLSFQDVVNFWWPRLKNSSLLIIGYFITACVCCVFFGWLEYFVLLCFVLLSELKHFGVNTYYRPYVLKFELVGSFCTI